MSNALGVEPAQNHLRCALRFAIADEASLPLATYVRAFLPAYDRVFGLTHSGERLDRNVGAFARGNGAFTPIPAAPINEVLAASPVTMRSVLTAQADSLLAKLQGTYPLVLDEETVEDDLAVLTEAFGALLPGTVVYRRRTNLAQVEFIYPSMVLDAGKGQVRPQRPAVNPPKVRPPLRQGVSLGSADSSMVQNVITNFAFVLPAPWGPLAAGTISAIFGMAFGGGSSPDIAAIQQMIDNAVSALKEEMEEIQIQSDKTVVTTYFDWVAQTGLLDADSPDYEKCNTQIQSLLTTYLPQSGTVLTVCTDLADNWVHPSTWQPGSTAWTDASKDPGLQTLISAVTALFSVKSLIARLASVAAGQLQPSSTTTYDDDQHAQQMMQMWFDAVATSDALANGTAGRGARIALMAGSSPSAATLTDGSYYVVYQTDSGELRGFSSYAGEGSLGQQMEQSNTSPSVTALPGGAYAVAYRGTAGSLCVLTSDKTVVDSGIKLQAGSSPSIATLPDGTWVAAVQDDTGTLHTYATADGDQNLEQGLNAAGTSPSIVGLSTGNYEIAFRANTGTLFGNGADDFSNALTIMGGTSPSIAAAPDGTFLTAVQDDTGTLHTLSSTAVDTNAAQGMNQPGTSPSLAALPGGGYQTVFRANTGTLYGNGANDFATGVTIMSDTSPSLAVLPDGTLVVAVQTATSELHIWASDTPEFAVSYGMPPAWSSILSRFVANPTACQTVIQPFGDMGGYLNHQVLSEYALTYGWPAAIQQVTAQRRATRLANIGPVTYFDNRGTQCESGGGPAGGGGCWASGSDGYDWSDTADGSSYSENNDRWTSGFFNQNCHCTSSEPDVIANWSQHVASVALALDPGTLAVDTSSYGSIDQLMQQLQANAAQLATELPPVAPNGAPVPTVLSSGSLPPASSPWANATQVQYAVSSLGAASSYIGPRGAWSDAVSVDARTTGVSVDLSGLSAIPEDTVALQLWRLLTYEDPTTHAPSPGVPDAFTVIDVQSGAASPATYQDDAS
jgi:hypothetical protein